MTDYIQLAAALVRAAPTNAGDPLPTWGELEELGDLMRIAAVMIRRQGEERSKLLAACEDALATGERDMQPILDNGRLRDVLRAAIAKSTGATNAKS